MAFAVPIEGFDIPTYVFPNSTCAKHVRGYDAKQKHRVKQHANPPSNINKRRVKLTQFRNGMAQKH